MQANTERNVVQADLKERPKRKGVNLPAKLKTGSSHYDGFVANLSARGIGMYMETDSPESSADCAPGTTIDLEFLSPVGEALYLQCKVKWIRIHNIPPQGLTNSIGMEIIDPSPHYIELFKTLTFAI